MSGQLAGKVVLVTGAGSGIGRAAALAFAREGARLVVADVHQQSGQETVDLILHDEGCREEAIFVRCDISQAAEVEAMIAQTVEHFGRLDCAFNNAGIEGSGGALHKYSEEMFNRVLSVNVIGTWLCMRAEIEQMLRQGGGAIVNTASIAGLIASPTSGAAYTASKHAVVGLTKSAAVEYGAAGIRVNAVCPGPVQTPMMERIVGRLPGFIERASDTTPLGRLATAEEIAAAALWLCSDASGFVTGHTLTVDGGKVIL
ncbi:MAG: glucose 1-dehydrogenase [Chloroflexi bacterium]|nr:glucose 1-dehydrogenase [Chloroflexota bacterium]